jgi:hypothetical protein
MSDRKEISASLKYKNFFCGHIQQAFIPVCFIPCRCGVKQEIVGTKINE